MDTLAIDIETYSDVSLPDCGVHRYAASEQFEILLFAYSLNDEPTRIIDLASGQTMPEGGGVRQFRHPCCRSRCHWKAWAKH